MAKFDSFTSSSFDGLTVEGILGRLSTYEPSTTITSAPRRRRLQKTVSALEMPDNERVEESAAFGVPGKALQEAALVDCSNRHESASAASACETASVCAQRVLRDTANGSTVGAAPKGESRGGLCDRDPDESTVVALEEEEEEQHCPEISPTGNQGSDLMAAKRERQTARRQQTTESERHWARVLFLDVDGVLHPDTANSELRYFHEPCMQHLKWVVERTGCELVLSSSWRVDPSKERLLALKLAQHGLPAIQCKTRGGSGDETARHQLIAEWVASHDVGNWVAVDDLRSLAPRLGDSHVVETDGRTGLTGRSAAALAEKLLRRPGVPSASAPQQFAGLGGGAAPALV